MRFLGGKWRKKNDGEGNILRFNYLGFDFFAALKRLNAEDAEVSLRVQTNFVVLLSVLAERICQSALSCEHEPGAC